jgi:hypothetical protein
VTGGRKHTPQYRESPDVQPRGAPGVPPT